MKLLRVLYLFASCQLSTVTLAAATPAQATSILINNATTDMNQAYNMSSTGASNFLPNEPYYQYMFGTSVSIKLYAFFLDIPKGAMDIIYSAAQDDVSIHHRSILPMGSQSVYTWNITAVGGELALRLFPEEHMSWRIWGVVLRGLRQFMVEFEYVQLDFDVLFSSIGPVAHGTIEFTMGPGG